MHTPGAPWTKADVAAMLDEHGSAAAAAKAAGVSRQRMHQLMLAHGIAPLLTPLRDPSLRERGAVSITITRAQLKRLNARAVGRSRSAVVREALDALIASGQPTTAATGRGTVAVSVSLTAEHHAWLNAHGRGMRSALVQQALDVYFQSVASCGPSPCVRRNSSG